MPLILVQASSLHYCPSSSPDAQLDLKTPIYTPWTIAIRAAEKHENTKTEAFPAKIGGENAVGVAPGRFSTLSDVNTIITAMKRE
jgi:hypothetical protein